MTEKKEKLEKIARQIAECTQCGLHKNATRSVPGEGNPNTKVMFIGEGPGFWEDQRGVPFCGPSGKLLDKLFQSVSLSREEVWIGNVVKHRALNNRDPMPEEIEACRSFLDEQIRIIDPEIIVTLGRFSLNKFLPGEYISQVHGQARYVDIANKKRIVIPMYHPAAALRNGKIMVQLKEDFKKIGELSCPKADSTLAEKPAENSQKQLSLV